MGSEPAERPLIYCLVPADLGSRLHDMLRRHFLEDPSVSVVVERRAGERRAGADRRNAEASVRSERRRVLSGSRRTGERRVASVALDPSEAPELPRRARRFADRLTFFERLEPAGHEAEDRDTARLIGRFQAGDAEAFASIYTRYFDRVYGHLRLLLRDSHEAEDATQRVFTDVFENLAAYEQRGRPFTAWLFTIVRHEGIKVLRKRGRLQVTTPEEVNGRLDRAATEEEPPPALNWLSDSDLMLLVERLPEPQRQVLAMRYLLGLQMREIAQVLETSPNHVSVLHYRAMAYLRQRLVGLGRTPERRVRGPRTTIVTRHARVLRRRRYALSP